MKDPIREALEPALAALEQCAAWFTEYENLHAAKGSIDGDFKARTNAERAAYARRAAEAAQSLRGRVEGESGWRPINSAPRDGTHILLAAGQDHVGEGWWEDDDADPYPWKFIDTGMMGSRYRNKEDINGAHDGTPNAFMFTHWMPLPAPPSQSLRSLGEGGEKV